MGGGSGPPCRQRHLQYATVALRVLCPRTVPLAHETCCHFWWLSLGRSHHRARLTRDLFGHTMLSSKHVGICGQSIANERQAHQELLPAPKQQFLKSLRNQRRKGPWRHARVILLRCPLTKFLRNLVRSTHSCQGNQRTHASATIWNPLRSGVSAGSFDPFFDEGWNDIHSPEKKLEFQR